MVANQSSSKLETALNDRKNVMGILEIVWLLWKGLGDERGLEGGSWLAKGGKIFLFWRGLEGTSLFYAFALYLFWVPQNPCL